MKVAVSSKVEIKCFLTQEQIETIVEYVSKSLPNNLDDLSDIDTLMFDETIRVCVDFEKGLFGDLQIKNAEILDSDWDVLENDSFLFAKQLNTLVTDYNSSKKIIADDGYSFREELARERYYNHKYSNRYEKTNL